MFGIGTTELILIIIVLIFLFGAKKIPDLAKGIGQSVRHLRKAVRDDEEDAKK